MFNKEKMEEVISKLSDNQAVSRVKSSKIGGGKDMININMEIDSLPYKHLTWIEQVFDQPLDFTHIGFERAGKYAHFIYEARNDDIIVTATFQREVEKAVS